MNIIMKDINDIVPYEKNPRKNDASVPYVANSIKEFGFKVPIVVDKKGIVVTGHTRLKAAKSLGMNEVPCVVADDLAPEQVKAFRLADNKVAEFSLWDDTLLSDELTGIFDIDMADFGLELPEIDDDEPEYYGAERERTADAYNLHDVDLVRTDGKYQMPMLRKETHVPKDLISFNYVLSSDKYEKGVHFYIDDYQFERMWNDPHKYLDKLAIFDCCLTPDFSLYLDMPIAMQIWNVYRSRMVGQIMQDYGIRVIPTLSWSTSESFDFCFDGIEPGGVVSVSTIGVKRDATAMELWTKGMDEVLRRLTPTVVVVYGGDIGYDFGNTGAVYISNHNADRIAGKKTDEVV